MLQELCNRGFRVPTNAQKYGWPYIHSGEDVTLISPPRTGKTLAYLLPVLTKIGTRTKGVTSVSCSAVEYYVFLVTCVKFVNACSV